MSRVCDRLKIIMKNPALWLFLIAMFITVAVSSAKAEAQGVFNTLSEEQQNKVLEKVRDELLALQTWSIDRQKAEEKASKSLKELLEEQAKDDDKAKKITPGGKVFNHSKEYAQLAGKFIANNLKDFSQVAGEVSAGDYTKAKKLVPEWGSAAFGKLASDALEGYGYPKTKTVWDELIDNSSSLKKVTIALASGNAANLDKVFWEETQVVGKKYSKKIVAGVLNWIFSDINAGWDKLTGIKVSVGDAYVALVEVELELIQVGKNIIKGKARECLDLYVSEYERLNGDKDAAYEAFQICDEDKDSSSYFRELDAYIGKGNKNLQGVYTEMLEAYRNYIPLDLWLEKRLGARKKKIKAEVNSGLRTTQRRFETISVGFMGTLQVRLNQLAWEEMTEEVKDDLEMQLAAILNEINPKLKRMRERRDKTLARCAAYDAAEARARAALGRGEQVSLGLSRLKFDIESLPSCDSAGYVMRQLAPLVTRAESERQAFESHIDVMKQAVKNACDHAGSVKTAAGKSEAREHVDKCQDAAREAANAIEKARAGIAKLSKTRDGAARIAGRVNEDRLTNVMEELGRQEQRLSALQDSIPAIEKSLAEAKASMSSQLKPVNTGAAWIEQTANEIEKLLRPFKDAPAAMKGANRVKLILEEVRRLTDSVTACSYRINKSWSEGDPIRQVSPWKYKDVMITTSPNYLAGMIAKARRSCSEFANEAKPSDVVKQISDLYSGAEDQRVLFDIALEGYKRCVTQSLVAYNEYWLSPDAKAALNSCDFEKARSLIDQMPAGPKRAGLEQEYQASVSLEDRLIALVEKANGKYKERRYGDALSILDGALGQAKCDRHIDSINKKIARVNATVLKVYNNAKATLDSCDFEGARKFIDLIPPGSKRAELEQEYQASVSLENRLKALVEKANGEYGSRNYATALSTLNGALGQAKCDRHIKSINKKIAKVNGALDKDSNNAKAAINSCDFKEARSLIDQMPAGPKRTELEQKYQASVSLENRLKALVEKANSEYGSRNYEAALSTLNGALGQAKCDRHIESINNKIAQVKSKIGPAPEEQVAATVPDVFGKNVEVAKRLIFGVDMVPSVNRKKRTSDKNKVDKVYDQYPSAGSPVVRDDTVTLYVYSKSKAKTKPVPPPDDDEEYYEINRESVYINNCCKKALDYWGKGPDYYYALFEVLEKRKKEKDRYLHCDNDIIPEYYAKNFLRASSRTPRQNAISKPETPEDFVAKERGKGKNIRLLQIVNTREEVERLQKKFCPDNRNLSVVGGKQMEEFLKEWEPIEQIIKEKIQELEASGQLENLTEKEKEDKVGLLIFRKVKINILENGVIVETIMGDDFLQALKALD